MPEYVPVGISGFEKLSDGAPRGLPVLLVGPSGCGKTIFGLQFIAEGLKNGEPALIINTDYSVEEMSEIFEEFKFGDFNKYKENGLIKFIDCYSWRLGPPYERKYIMKNPKDVMSLLRLVRTAREELGQKTKIRTFFDSITSLILHAGFSAVYRTMVQLKARAAPFIASIYTLQQGTHPPEVIGAFKHSSRGGVIEFKLVEEEDALKRLIRIGKWRGKHDSSWHPLKITEHGLVIE